MPQIPQCCCEGMDTGHCWGCADGTWFGYVGDYDSALADCQDPGASTGGPIGPGGAYPVKPMLDKVPNRKPRPSISRPRRDKRNFTNNGQSNAIWSGAQSNVGPRDRVFAGNYASGRKCNCY